MGGTNIDLQKLESRAQSLAPFIEYTELAKKSQEHLKKRARCVWEVVEQQKRITVTKRLGFDIRVRRERLPYVITGENTHEVDDDSVPSSQAAGCGDVERAKKKGDATVPWSPHRQSVDEDEYKASTIAATLQ